MTAARSSVPPFPWKNDRPLQHAACVDPPAELRRFYADGSPVKRDGTLMLRAGPGAPRRAGRRTIPQESDT